MARQTSFTVSRTLAEFRLLPGLTTRDTILRKVSLRTPLVWTAPGQPEITLNAPVMSAAMQAVSGPQMGIELARLGGVAVIFASQPPASQAAMVAKIKRHRAGFVEPHTVRGGLTIRELAVYSAEVGHSTFPVVGADGVLEGLITRNDYDLRSHSDADVAQRMVPRSRLLVGVGLTDLEEANRLLIESHHSVLPVVDHSGHLLSLVFRKDMDDFLDNPSQVVDARKRLIAVAAINTHDYRERVPALVAAEVDVVAVDSSDGHSVFQQETLAWCKTTYPDLPVIGGNVITAEGFDAMAKWGADAVKVGMGGGSICITQEQKGTGRGLATAVMDVVAARDRYHERTGRYIPVIADGGIVTSKDIVIALALGADSCMLGRYFARMDESNTQKTVINGRVMKPYWGEGSARARQWREARYHHASFVEGVEGFVDYAGKLKDELPKTLAKIKASMSSCGVATLAALHTEARLEAVSALSIREGQPHDIFMPGGESTWS